jgi:glycosyltransferase involved in cell wall biosynthesis
LVNPQDPARIAEKLRCLILSQKLREDMGTYNRLHVRRYSIEQTVTGYLDLYQKVF